MTEHHPETRIRRALNELAAPAKRRSADELWEQPVERAAGNEWYLDGTETGGRVSQRILALGLSAACFLVFLLGVSFFYLVPNSRIYLDVNPSLELRLNRFDRVLEVEGLNPEGEALLEGLNLKHQRADEALKRLADALCRRGYLSAKKNVMLLSAESTDPAKSDALSRSLSWELHGFLHQLIGKNRIYYQSLGGSETESLSAQLQKSFSLSRGKAGLLAKILEKYPELEAESLSRKSCLQLENTLKEQKIFLQKLFACWSDDAFDEDEELDDEAGEHDAAEKVSETKGRGERDGANDDEQDEREERQERERESMEDLDDPDEKDTDDRDADEDEEEAGGAQAVTGVVPTGASGDDEPELDDDPSFDEPFDAEEPDEAGNPFYDDDDLDFSESDDDPDEDDLD